MQVKSPSFSEWCLPSADKESGTDKESGQCLVDPSISFGVIKVVVLVAEPSSPWWPGGFHPVPLTRPSGSTRVAP